MSVPLDTGCGCEKHEVKMHKLSTECRSNICFFPGCSEEGWSKEGGRAAISTEKDRGAAGDH